MTVISGRTSVPPSVRRPLGEHEPNAVPTPDERRTGRPVDRPQIGGEVGEAWGQEPGVSESGVEDQGDQDRGVEDPGVLGPRCLGLGGVGARSGVGSVGLDDGGRGQDDRELVVLDAAEGPAGVASARARATSRSSAASVRSGPASAADGGARARRPGRGRASHASSRRAAMASASPPSTVKPSSSMTVPS